MSHYKTISGRKRIPRRVEQLACEFHKDVLIRRAAGDSKPAYHAQAPKVTAYRLLLESGYTVKQAVRAFERLRRRCGPVTLGRSRRRR